MSASVIAGSAAILRYFHKLTAQGRDVCVCDSRFVTVVQLVDLLLPAVAGAIVPKARAAVAAPAAAAGLFGLKVLRILCTIGACSQSMSGRQRCDG